tara:strand:+ start:1837 stop:2331 length:495 start_codon:yes stop_codon:yes gene_type:complete
MARRLRYGKGKGSIEISGLQKKLIEEAIRDVAPLTLHILETELDDRIDYAKKNWNVRYGQPVKTKSGRTYIKKEESKNSIDKFSSGIRIIQKGKAVEGFFRNTAPYAYNIKAADYSKRKNGSPSTVPAGKLVAEVTMWEPAKSNVDKIVKKLADAYIMEQKKVK